MNRYIILIACFCCLFSSCTMDNLDKSLNAEETIMHAQFRSQSFTSINTDNVDHEDWVTSLAMIVFPTGRNDRFAFEHVEAQDALTSNPTAIPLSQLDFKVKVIKGYNDIIFIANVPLSDLENLVTRSQVYDYLNKTHYFEHNETANNGFALPMARVYYNQLIGDGSDITPFVFRPARSALNEPFAPVSRFGKGVLRIQDVDDKVGLVRACAKISLTLKGEGAKDIKSALCYNAPSQYSLQQLNTGAVYESKSIPVTFQLSDIGVNGERTAKVYIPEKLFPLSDRVVWSTGQDRIVYLKLVTHAGREQLIPIVTDAPNNGTYLEYATASVSSESPNFDVIRNIHYHFNVHVKADARQINVTLQVLPWNLIDSEIVFGEPQYTAFVSFPENGQWMPDGKTILLNGKSKAKIKFRMRAPKGGIWQASLTNGLDFVLQPLPDSDLDVAANEKPGVRGIADDQTVYCFYVVPLRPFDGTPKLTELYITINGKEIQLSSKLAADGIESGPTRRLVFKQVE
ncbi:hypothetical protein [Porphyromonas pogonae]|uniref:hypothetical protein n=2 Tax=Porphyromonas pogonae TaxID=867595 RepID=UPI002E7A6F54|nr:hypothetical protein [Porphyromonas pogonae]